MCLVPCDGRRQHLSKLAITLHRRLRLACLLACYTNKRTHRPQSVLGQIIIDALQFTALILHRSEWCLLNVWNCRHSAETPNANHLSSAHIEQTNCCGCRYFCTACNALCMCCSICILSSDNMCSFHFTSFPFVFFFALISWWRVLLCSQRNVFIYVYRCYIRRWNIKMRKHTMMMKAQSSATFDRSCARCAF